MPADANNFACPTYFDEQSGTAASYCPAGCAYTATVSDSCTSTATATATTTDTARCTLTPTTDFGVNPGSCAAVGATATCALVAGTYSGTPSDTVVTVESCTSTLVATVTTTDTASCNLSPTADSGATDGTCAIATGWSCADKIGDGATTVDPVTHTDCGVGWDAGGTSALTAAFDVTIAAHKSACCTQCASGTWAPAGATACAAHTTDACATGSGWAGSTTADDGACTACAAGKYNNAADTSICGDCAAGSVVEVGAGNGAATTAGTSCTSCTATTNNDHDGDSSTACQANTVTACATAGEGFTAGTALSDATCTACVIGTTFTAGGGTAACATSVVTCGTAGEGNVASADAISANTCAVCPVNTYAAAGDGSCLETCADGFVIEVGTGTGAVVSAGTTCTTCAAGTDFDHDGIPSTACQAIATGASTPSAITACVAGEGFVAASATADAHCVNCAAGVNFDDHTAAGGSCVAITPTVCAAGSGYASDATATTDDTAAACTACTAGKFSAGTQALCTDCTVGTWSAASATTCTPCASGTTTAGTGAAGPTATACVVAVDIPVSIAACDYVAAYTPTCPAGCDGQAASNCPGGCDYVPRMDEETADRAACGSEDADCIYIEAGSGAGVRPDVFQDCIAMDMCTYSYVFDGSPGCPTGCSQPASTVYDPRVKCVKDEQQALCQAASVSARACANATLALPHNCEYVGTNCDAVAVDASFCELQRNDQNGWSGPDDGPADMITLPQMTFACPPTAACDYAWAISPYVPAACDTVCGQHELQRHRTVTCLGPFGDTTIAAATAAKPVELTISAAAVASGDTVTIVGITGDMGVDVLNKRSFVAVVTEGANGTAATKITLYTDASRSTGVDTTGKTCTSGGMLAIGHALAPEAECLHDVSGAGVKPLTSATCAATRACAVDMCSGNTDATMDYTCPAGTRKTGSDGILCPRDADCAGEWSTCSSSCLRTYRVTDRGAGSGAPCPVGHGETQQCMGGEGDCPVDADCVGSWSRCYGDCTRHYQVLSAATGAGAPCPVDDGTEGVCTPGDDACPLDTDCVGAWTTCMASCAPKTYAVTTAQSGNGVACPVVDGSTLMCAHDDDQCVWSDCVGSWDTSTCTVGCTERKTYTIETQRTGSGARCPVAAGDTMLCQPGDGDCPDGVVSANCAGSYGTCAMDCIQRYEAHTPATGTGTCAFGGTSRACSGGNCPSECTINTPLLPKLMGDCNPGVFNHGDSCRMACATGYTYGGIVVCNNGQILSSAVCMVVPAGAAEVPASTTLQGAISEDSFRAGVEDANDGAQVSITSYEMSVDMDTRCDFVLFCSLCCSHVHSFQTHISVGTGTGSRSLRPLCRQQRASCSSSRAWRRASVCL